MYALQTSGGLLISVAEEDATDLLIDLYIKDIEAAVIAKAEKGERGIKIKLNR